MNSHDRVLAALRREQPDRVPFVEGGIDPPMQRALMEREDFLPEELNERIGLDNLLVEFLPPIFGEYAVHDGINFLAKPLLLTRADLDRMVFPDPEDPAFYQAAEAIIRRNQGKYAIAAKMRMGASAMLMSMGLEAFSYALADDPGLVDTILRRYVDWTVAIVRHLKDLGVDYVWTFDDMAYKTGPMFSPQVFRDHFLPHLRRVAAAIKGEGFPWILHSDGNLMLLLDDLLTLGFDALHPLEPGPMDIEAVKRDVRSSALSGRQHRFALHLDARHTRRGGRRGQTTDRSHRQRRRLYDQQRQLDHVLLQSRECVGDDSRHPQVWGLRLRTILAENT